MLWGKPKEALEICNANLLKQWWTRCSVYGGEIEWMTLKEFWQEFVNDRFYLQTIHLRTEQLLNV